MVLCIETEQLTRDPEAKLSVFEVKSFNAILDTIPFLSLDALAISDNAYSYRNRLLASPYTEPFLRAASTVDAPHLVRKTSDMEHAWLKVMYEQA